MSWIDFKNEKKIAFANEIYAYRYQYVRVYFVKMSIESKTEDKKNMIALLMQHAIFNLIAKSMALVQFKYLRH